MVVTTGADPVFVEDKVASPLVRSTVVAAGESLVEVSADRGWMSSLPPAAFPVVIDPDLAIGPTWWASYLGGVPSSTCGVAPACGHRAGHPMIPGYPWSMWRSLNIFDLASVASAYQLTGGNYPRLLSAQVGLNRTAGSTASTQVNLHVPNAYSWEGVTGGGLLGSATSTSSYVYDVTGHMHGKLAASDTGFAFGLASDASVYNYKQFDFGLFLVVNDAPPAPSATAPPNGKAWFAKTVSAAPTLTVAPVSDSTLAPGWTAVKYHFSVSTTPPGITDYWGNVAARASEPGTSFALSPSVLKDGHTYYWRAWSSDGINMTPSPVFSFRFDRRLGTSGPSPYVDVGPLKVNAATGNAMFTWSQRPVATLGGGAAVSLTYNSLLSAGSSVVEATEGLPPGWMASWGSVPVTRLELIPGGSAVVRLADGGKEAFTWESNTWKTVEPLQNTVLRTIGTSPVQYQWESPSGWLVNFDAAGKILNATQQGDDAAPTALGYEWATLGSAKVLRKIIDPVVPSSGRTMQFLYGGETGCPVPDSAAASSGLVVAPGGLLCQITHMDGSKVAFWYRTSGSSSQISRIVDDGNGNFASGTDDQAVWDLGWDSSFKIQEIRDPQTMRQIAAGVLPNSGGVLTTPANHRTDITFDGNGRVQTITGPKPDATHSRPGATFAYPSDTVTTMTEANRTEPNGYTTRWTIDARGRAITVQDRMARATHTRWVDADTDRVQWSDTQSLTAAGATQFLRSGTVYDDRGRPIEQWGPAPRSEFGATSEANGNATGGAGTPKTTTAYDTGLTGLALTLWSNAQQSGKPTAHGHMTSAAMTTTGSPHSLIAGSDNWSLRAAGSIRFPAAGTYTVSVVANGPVRFQAGDGWADSWSTADPGAGGTVTTSTTVNVAAPDAGKWVPIVVDTADASGTGGLTIQWTPPSGPLQNVPSSELRPEFGLPTASTTRVDATTTLNTTTSYDDPATSPLNESYLGIPRVTTDDPGGANRQTIETFEPSTSGSFLRRTGRQLPAGSGSNVTYDYYTATGGPIANVCGATGTTKQLGMLKRTTQADPDGTGPELPLIREYVYDSAGRQAGYRASTAVSSEPWTCTTYDAMGRVATVAYPAWNGQSARTVTYNYRVGSNPTVTSVGDSAGTITTTSDWAGRPISTVDVWAKTSTTTYDNLGRVATAVNSGGTLGYTYGTDNQITQITLNGKPITQPAYDALTRPTGVTYPSGTSNAGNGSSGQFTYDDRGLPVGNTWTGPSSTPLTSDQVTRDLIGRVVNQSTDGFDPNGATRNYVYAATGELTSAVNFAAAPAAAAATRTTTLNRPGSDGGSFYWIPTPVGSVCWAA